MRIGIFPGQYFDSETGLHYNWHRYYNQETGRYSRPDPIGSAGGMNLFLYADANPVMWTDPLGLNPSSDFYSGVTSYDKGIYRTFRYAARRVGFYGECEKLCSEIEGFIFYEILYQLKNPKVREQAVKFGWKYIKNNKIKSFGRIGTGAAMKHALSRGGGLGSALGGALTT